ncbi:MAG TPA: hydroxymethylpyrimidine/phosphomethylpyrimidine kinase [Paludibacter sp.]|nr:hydroxymethylpyrimidine/phosphomethylpyrimidine kinase [Paludibacter sp.]
MNSNRPYCLTVAGFDPTAGAGVLTDTKTFEMLEVYGMGIITSNTLQTDSLFIDVEWISIETIKKQLETLLKNYEFNSLKIGLVQNFEMLYEIISVAKSLNPDLKIVWDPILKSSSGFDFHAKDSLELSFLEENCTLITPNWNEFETLWGTDPEILKERNPKTAILIKGGHRLENAGCDLLFEKGIHTEISGTPFHGKSKHGTGCVLSAAIAAYTAKGNSLIDSCKKAKTYIEKFILSNDLNLGYHHADK